MKQKSLKFYLQKKNIITVVSLYSAIYEATQSVSFVSIKYRHLATQFILFLSLRKNINYSRFEHLQINFCLAQYIFAALLINLCRF